MEGNERRSRSCRGFDRPQGDRSYVPGIAHTAARVGQPEELGEEYRFTLVLIPARSRLLARGPHEVGPRRTGAVVCPDVSGNRGDTSGRTPCGKTARRSAMMFTDPRRMHKYHGIHAYHASDGVEGPRVHDPSCPQGDAAPP